MAKFFETINSDLIDFIKMQKIFFVSTAMSEGRINTSPKGMDSFRVINENKVIWLNLTGSGNETAIHLSKNDRMTIMFCSFDKKPLILRLYGNAKTYHTHDEKYNAFIDLFPKTPGSRQIIEMDINMVQTSCGYAIPYMDFVSERTTLNLSNDKKQKDGRLEDYWKEKNQTSIDGIKSDTFR